MPASSRSQLLNDELPDFRRPTVAGEMLDSETLGGKVVVVKFFAKYCRPCQWTLPKAEKLHRAHDDVVIIGVSEDEHLQDVWDQVRRYDLSFPVVHDRGNVLAGRFRVTELPITFVTDRSRRIVWIGGPDKAAEVDQAVEAIRNPPSTE